MMAKDRANDSSRRPDLPGFEGTWAAFDSLIKKGESIVDKRKEEDQIEDSFARADMERDK
jgi:hypothetical protein